MDSAFSANDEWIVSDYWFPYGKAKDCQEFWSSFNKKRNEKKNMSTKNRSMIQQLREQVGPKGFIYGCTMKESIFVTIFIAVFVLGFMSILVYCLKGRKVLVKVNTWKNNGIEELLPSLRKKFARNRNQDQEAGIEMGERS